MKTFYPCSNFFRLMSVMTLAFFQISVFAQFSATSTSAGSATTVSVAQGFDWASPNNIQASDGVYATCNISGSNKSSYYLDAKSWGFQSTTSGQPNYIPPGATINGVEVNIKLRRTLTGTAKERKVILLKAGAEAGTSKAGGTNWPTTAITKKFGSNVDLWGATWTAADLINAGFGVRVQARNQGNKTTQAEIDYISITVYFNQIFFYSKSSGNLELTATWGTNTDGTGTAPTNFTSNGQIFTLRNRATATLTANLAISGTNSKMIVGDGTTATALTIPSNFALTGLTDVATASSLNINNTVIPTLGSIAANTTVTFSALANQNVPEAHYYNLTLSGSGNKLLQTATGITSVTNTLTINSGVTFNNQGNHVIITGAANGISNNGAAIGAGHYTYSLVDVSTSITGSGTYNNLEIEFSTTSATRSLALGGATTITGTLTLTEGNLANGTQLTMSPGSTVVVADGILGGDITSSTGYNVTYNPYTVASPKATSGEIGGIVNNLTLQTGTGLTINLNRNLVLTGNLLLTSGTLDPTSSNYNITLGGNFTNNATLTQRNNVITFNGTTAQTVNASAAQSFYDMTINSGADGSVQLNVPVTVNHTLALMNGLLTTTATNLLTLSQTATAASGGSNTSYVNGPLAQVLAAVSGTRIYPIGKNSAYRPISLSLNQATTTATTYTAEMFPGAPPARTFPADINRVSQIRYFTVTSSNNANLSNATITINYGADDGVTDPPNLRIAKSNGTAWQNIGGAGTAVPVGSITSGTFTSFSDFVLANAIGGSNPLPLTWLSFTALRKERTVELKWQTANEVNTARFEIERSINGIDWYKIGQIATNNGATNEYLYIDQSPVQPVNYYRIRLVDIDGKESFSKIAVVSFTQSAQSIIIAPNPVNNPTIRFFVGDAKILQQDNVEVKIIDMSGRTLFRVITQPGTVMEIVPGKLLAGKYILQVRGGQQSVQSGFIVQ